MSSVRFSFLELRYGCHRQRFEFPDDDGPFVISGPNGSGKSTIVEGLVRTLYGFRRQRKDDKKIYEQRRPWVDTEYRATVGLHGPAGQVVVERDFESDQVVVRSDTAAGPSFEGEANPAGSGDAVREYRQVLSDCFGLSDLDAYERTACVQQGGLLQTNLSEDLLRIAAGGHADVDTARDELRKAYQPLTIEPITEGDGRRRKPGMLEIARRTCEELRSRRDEARAAEQRRAPLAAQRESVRTAAAEAASEIEVLERALEALAQTETFEARKKACRERLGYLEHRAQELDEAIGRVELMEAAPADAPERQYPVDFPERVAALEEGLWPRERKLMADIEAHRARLRQLAAAPALRSAPVWIAGLALAAGGAATAAIGSGVVGATAGLIGAALIAVALWWRRGETERARCERGLLATESDLDDVRNRISARVDGVPDAESLTVETLPDRRREYDRQKDERDSRTAVRNELRRVVDEARRALARAAAAGASDEPPDDTVREADPARAVPRDETLLERAHEIRKELHEAASKERNRLSTIDLQLREVSRSQFELPDGVRPETAAVRHRLVERRADSTGLGDELNRLERRIAYDGRPDESSVAIESQLRVAETRLAELEARSAAYRHAFGLVTDAYEDFRQTDQDRLLAAISGHLRDATDGDLGPIAAEEGLETARVWLRGHKVPMDSPPLSYGQLHTALFAVRLGAADFLAGLGVRVPLLVDDPFVHLDEQRAGELWDVLTRLSTDRQVILATQDRLVLDHLRIRPHLSLESESRPESPVAASEPEARVAEQAPAPVDQAPAPPAESETPEPEPETPDLWSHL
jgi:DNA repair exonuclease SbcCD ATPase subunit